MMKRVEADLGIVEILQTDYSAIDSDKPLYKVGSKEIYQRNLKRLLSAKDAEEKEILNLIVKKIIEKDVVEAYKHLIEYGYCTRVFDEKGETAVHFAFEINYMFLQRDKGTLLFRTTGDFNHSDCYGLSYLHIASALGNTIVTKKFLNNNADINVQCNYKSSHYDGNYDDCDGFTPLHFAVKHHRYDTVKLLLEHGADIESKDRQQNTPLYIASQVKNYDYPSSWESDLEIMEILIKYGSKIDTKAIIHNFHNYYYTKDDVLRENEFDIETNEFINKSIEIDYKERQKEKLELLIKKGADVSVSTTYGITVLHSVLDNLETTRFPTSFEEISFDDTKYVEMVQLILSTNSEVASLKTKSGESPLSLAVFYMSFDIVKLLLNYTTDLSGIKFDLEIKGVFSFFDMIPTFECARNLIAIVELLLAKGYKLRLKDNLNILKFLIHDCDKCKCHADYSLRSTSVLPSELGRAVNFYSSIHISCLNAIANKPHRLGDLDDLQLTLELIDYAKLYIHKDIKNMVENLLQEYDIPLVRNLYVEDNFKEVELMKSIKMRGEVSLYDVMTKHPHDIYPYIQDHIFNESIFELSETGEDLELYEFIIKGHFAKSVTRHYVETSAYDYLPFSLLSLLPHVCCRRILYYLDNKDIWNFCFALSPDDPDEERSLNMQVDN